MNSNPNYVRPGGQNTEYGGYPNKSHGNFNQGGGNTGWGTQHGNYGKNFNQPYNQGQGGSTNPNPNYKNPNMAPKGD